MLDRIDLVETENLLAAVEVQCWVSVIFSPKSESLLVAQLSRYLPKLDCKR